MRECKFPAGIFAHETRDSWELQLNDDGTYLFFANGVVDSTGSYSITGDLYIETTDYVPCKQARTATYQWTFDGTHLTFRLVGEDRCGPRLDRLDGASWIRRLRPQETVPGERASGNPEKA